MEREQEVIFRIVKKIGRHIEGQRISRYGVLRSAAIDESHYWQKYWVLGYDNFLETDDSCLDSVACIDESEFVICFEL